MERYLYIATLTRIDHLSIEEVKKIALKARGEGKRAEILTKEEAQRKGLFEPMQDLTKVKVI